MLAIGDLEYDRDDRAHPTHEPAVVRRSNTRQVSLIASLAHSTGIPVRHIREALRAGRKLEDLVL